MFAQDKFLENEMKNPLGVSLPCNNCSGDCCGPVPMTQEQHTEIFKKYLNKKEFKKRFPWPASTVGRHLVYGNIGIPGALVLTFKNKAHMKKIGLTDSDCVYKKDPITGGCLIYEDRPVVCKAYGQVKSLQCPYAGLEAQLPDTPERRSIINSCLKNNQMEILNAHKCGKINDSYK